MSSIYRLIFLLAFILSLVYASSQAADTETYEEELPPANVLQPSRRHNTKSRTNSMEKVQPSYEDDKENYKTTGVYPSELKTKAKNLKPASRHDKDPRRLDSKEAKAADLVTEKWFDNEDKIEQSHIKYLERKALKSKDRSASESLDNRKYRVKLQDGKTKVKMNVGRVRMEFDQDTASKKQRNGGARKGPNRPDRRSRKAGKQMMAKWRSGGGKGIPPAPPAPPRPSKRAPSRRQTRPAGRRQRQKPVDSDA